MSSKNKLNSHIEDAEKMDISNINNAANKELERDLRILHLQNSINNKKNKLKKRDTN